MVICGADVRFCPTLHIWQLTKAQCKLLEMFGRGGEVGGEGECGDAGQCGFRGSQ